MFAYLLGVAAAAASPAAVAVPVQIKYDFLTAIVPEPTPTGVQTVGLTDPWFFAKAYPKAVVRTIDATTIPGNGVALPTGTLLVIADAPYLIGCTFDAPIKFRLGMSRPCLIDLDKDGRFDHWFRRAGDVKFYGYSSQVSGDDILPLEGANPGFEVIDLSEIPEEHVTRLGARLWTGFFRFCTGDKEVKSVTMCLNMGEKLKRDGLHHELEYLGGRFDYQAVGKTFVVNTLVPPGRR